MENAVAEALLRRQLLEFTQALQKLTHRALSAAYSSHLNALHVLSDFTLQPQVNHAFTLHIDGRDLVASFPSIILRLTYADPSLRIKKFSVLSPKQQKTLFEYIYSPPAERFTWNDSAMRNELWLESQVTNSTALKLFHRAIPY